MRKYLLLIAALLSIAAPAGVAAAPAAGAAGKTQLVALSFRGGGFGRGGGGFGRGGGLFGRRSGRQHHILRRVARAAAFAYVLHLLFSHGGLSILFWIIAIALIVALLRRRRSRRRYAY